MTINKDKEFPFEEYTPFFEGMRSFLRRVQILGDIEALDWKVGLVLQNGDETNFEKVIEETSRENKVFQASYEWTMLSEILLNNSDENYVLTTFWLEMTKRSGFFSSDASVWIIRADTKAITDDDSIFFQLTIVDNMEDGGVGNNLVLPALRERGKHIVFVFSIEDFRALESDAVIIRSNLRRRITPMAFVGDVNTEDGNSAV